MCIMYDYLLSKDVSDGKASGNEIRQVAWAIFVAVGDVIGSELLLHLL